MIMNQLIKKVHMYSGLVSFTALVIFGAIGIVATFVPGPDDRSRPDSTVEEIDFAVPGNLDDRQLANHIQAELDLPLTSPAPDWSLGRNKDNNLRFRLPTPGHYYDVVVLETDNRVRIKKQPFDTWQYLFHLHEMMPRPGQADLRVKLWSYYGLFNVWSLILMTLSGLYLWVSTPRSRFRWAQVSFFLGAVFFVIFYMALK